MCGRKVRVRSKVGCCKPSHATESFPRQQRKRMPCMVSLCQNLENRKKTGERERIADARAVKREPPSEN